MKRLFIFILSLLPLTGFAFEQSQIQFPQTHFQSVNTYKQCTSYTPNITEVGAISLYNSQQSTNHTGKPRKVIHDPGEPFQTPIGDTPWVLMILLIGFYIIRKKWKRMHSLPL